MELKALGNSEVHVGQLLTLYSSDPENASNYEYSVLYVLVDFNLSHAMAEYYSTLVKTPTEIKTRDALAKFAAHLVAIGYAKVPDTVMVHLGEASRPPKRIFDEYKYRKSPVHFVFGQLKEELVVRTVDFFTHEGHYLIFINPQGVSDEFRLDLSLGDEFLGTLRLGVVAHSSRTVLINAHDLDRLCQQFNDLIQDLLPQQQIKIERITADITPGSKLLLDPEAYGKTQTWLNRSGNPPWGNRVPEQLALAAEG